MNGDGADVASMMGGATTAAAMYRLGYDGARMIQGFIDGGLDPAEAAVCTVDVLSNMLIAAQDGQ